MREVVIVAVAGFLIGIMVAALLVHFFGVIRSHERSPLPAALDCRATARVLYDRNLESHL
jgi:hypothetical protein